MLHQATEKFITQALEATIFLAPTEPGLTEDELIAAGREFGNHSTRDRVVVVVDLWHPDLSADEIAVLSGLHRYVAHQGRWLSRYHAANDGARRAALAHYY